jgi:hypothetical protein
VDAGLGGGASWLSALPGRQRSLRRGIPDLDHWVWPVSGFVGDGERG